jgi:hypothetical protein
LVSRDDTTGDDETSIVRRESSRQTIRTSQRLTTGKRQPDQKRRKHIMTALHHIRSTAIARANTLPRAARHLHQLRPAFAQWSAGEIYVCRKTGTYRFRNGERGKSVAPWDAVAREIFATPEAFAFAAMVLGKESHSAVPAAKPQPGAASRCRANVVALANS